jgi:hypothetical protein
VVEGLGAEGAEEDTGGVEGKVVGVGVWLERQMISLQGLKLSELDLVGGGADGLVARELQLLDEYSWGFLCMRRSSVSRERYSQRGARRRDCW